ncbi:MAG: P1 family peptidase [bacterium]|nr:P1 family peptidase [bacterium]
MRARDIGLFAASGSAGPLNAIVDVPGVAVGHVTLIDREGPLVVGEGPVRTGVTVVVPRPEPVALNPVFAGIGRLNGNGEMTGSHWIEESGLLTSPIALTNTHSVGVVRDALVQVERSQRSGSDWWSLPVVAETWDGLLNDINGSHVSEGDVCAALDAASSGPVPEGNVGSGTGMICHGFKGGIGTSSRVVGGSAGNEGGDAAGNAAGNPGGEAADDATGEAARGTAGNAAGYTVGVLVQANHGSRRRLVIDGFPVGRHLDESVVPLPGGDLPEGMGSIISVVATDAPLLPHQCRSLAARTALGIGRVGGVGEHWSGDLSIAFATGHSDLGRGRLGAGEQEGSPGRSGSAAWEGSSEEVVSPGGRGLESGRDSPGSDRDPHEPAAAWPLLVDAGTLVALYEATVDATEEAIVNALFAAETMTGRDGITAHELPIELVLELMSTGGPPS